MVMNQVKFSRNKTSAEALGSEDPDVIYFTSDKHEIVMGGDVYGGGLEKDKKDYLDKLYEDYQKSLFTVTVSSSKSIVNPGTEVTITVTVRNNGVNCPSDSGVSGNGFLGSRSFTESSVGVYKTTAQVSQIGVNTSEITVSYNGIVKKVSVSVSCYNNIIYGWSTEETTTGSDLRGASSKGPQASCAGEYNFRNTEDGYYFLLIPAGVSIASSLSGSKPQGTEGPIPVYFVRQEIPGYTVFRIEDKQAPSEHTIKFS